MTGSEGLRQRINDFLHGLDHKGLAIILAGDGFLRPFQDAADCLRQNPDIRQRFFRERTFPLFQTGQVVGDIDGMVADPLIAGQGLDLVALADGILFQRNIGGQIHHIAVGGVRHMIQQVFPLVHALLPGIIIFKKLLNTGFIVVYGCLTHMLDQLTGLVQGQGRIGDQMHIQFLQMLFQLRILVLLRGPVRHDPLRQRGKSA